MTSMNNGNDSEEKKKISLLSSSSSPSSSSWDLVLDSNFEALDMKASVHDRQNSSSMSVGSCFTGTTWNTANTETNATTGLSNNSSNNVGVESLDLRLLEPTPIIAASNGNLLAVPSVNNLLSSLITSRDEILEALSNIEVRAPSSSSTSANVATAAFSVQQDSLLSTPSSALLAHDMLSVELHSYHAGSAGVLGCQQAQLQQPTLQGTSSSATTNASGAATSATTSAAASSSVASVDISTNDEDVDPANNDMKIHPYQHERWMERYRDLVSFYEEKGHCNVPYVYKAKPVLGQWVKRQRHQYKLREQGQHSNLTEDRVKMLSLLGFLWDSHGAAWEEKFCELCEFRRIHGHCNVPCLFNGNSKLSTWLKRQRRQYRLFMAQQSSTMDYERIAKLEDLGFVWDYYGAGKSS